MVSEEEETKEEKDRIKTPRGKDWEKGFTIEEHRVAEYVELYESIGYKVCVEPATPDEQEECHSCFKAEFDNLKTIYIKRKKNKNNEMDLEELL